MTKKHFEQIAEVIKNDVAYLENQKVVANVIIQVATKLNPRFDKVKFLKACGL